MYVGVGAVIGATLALLFAPKSGLELRGDIADVSRKGYDATLETAKGLKDQSYVAAMAVKDKANAVLDLASAKLATGSDAVNNVVAATTGAVKAGIERMENEGGGTNAKGVGNHRT
jgi:gas vesicle protein